MALVVADRVKETTTTTGTGTITLAGAATGFQSFSVIGNGNTTYYTIAGQTGGEWEVGIGTYTSSGTTLSRDTVLASSNSGSLVNFSAGTKDVFVTYPASYSVATQFANTFTSNQVISDNSANAALRITQTGAGNALLVEDSANPDSTPFVIDASGKVAIGATTATENLNIVSDGRNFLQMTRASTNTTESVFAIRKARGTNASPTIVSAGDNIGTHQFLGYDGTQYLVAAQIYSSIDGTPGTNDMPGNLVFSTTADGASSPTERMRIDSAGRVSIGSGFAGAMLSNQAPQTGAASTFGITNWGTVQSGVTVQANYYHSAASTAAASFTLSNLRHYYATQGSFGAGSTVTDQYGFLAESNLTGATNNYGFYSNIASGTGRWNFYAAGTARNYFGGTTTISVNDTTDALRITQTGAGNALVVEDSANPDATPLVVTADGRAVVGYTAAITGPGANTSALQTHSTSVFQMGFGGTYWGSDTNPVGAYLAKSRGAAIGTRGVVASGDQLGRLSFAGDDGTNFIEAARVEVAVDGTPGTNDMPGRLVFSTTADGAVVPTERMRIDNAGQVGIGGTPISGQSFNVSKSITGSTDSMGIRSTGTVQSGVTSSARAFDASFATAATAFTLSNAVHYYANGITVGAGSTVTNQYGFQVTSNLTGATNNYGFLGEIASGTGRWNLYMGGTASNYLAGDLRIGTTTNTNSSKIVAAGVIESTSGGFKFPDGTTQTSAGTSSGKAIAFAMILGG